MEALEAIFTRRSIRKFKTTQVSKDDLELMLKAAMYAPSARNTQSWHFVVSDKREALNKITELHPYAQMLKEAPLAILVCGDKSIESNEGYNCINCSAATQNILLAAHALGLGSFWLGVYPRKERMDLLAKLFKLPADIIPISLAAIGYSDEIKEQPQRFLKDRIHFNKF
jgi:nitroreductase